LILRRKILNQFQKNIALVLTVLLVFLLVWQLYNQPKSGTKDIIYSEMTALLDKGEIIEFFFASASYYFKSENPKFTTATIQYYKTPPSDRINNIKPIIRRINIDIIERENQLKIGKRDMDDLVDEIEELKHGLLIIAKDAEEKKR